MKLGIKVTYVNGYYSHAIENDIIAEFDDISLAKNAMKEIIEHNVMISELGKSKCVGLILCKWSIKDWFYKTTNPYSIKLDSVVNQAYVNKNQDDIEYRISEFDATMNINLLQEDGDRKLFDIPHYNIGSLRTIEIILMEDDIFFEL